MRLNLAAGLVRAAAELGWARLRLARLSPEELLAAVHTGVDVERTNVRLPSDIAQVAYLLPRVAARLPWRTDCLVQALAARRWLESLGHGSELFLGAKKGAGGFEAHAWCKWGDHVVTGGRIDDYARLTAPPPAR